MMTVLNNTANTSGVLRRLAGLAGTIVTSYRNHFGLFWRVMVPLVIVAILHDTSMFFYTDTKFEKVEEVTFNRIVDTVTGISSTSTREPGVNWQLAPYPEFRLTGTDGITWMWYLNFRSFEYSLLLLTMCPLSFAVAHMYHRQKITARDVYRQVSRRTWAILGANLLLVLIVDAGPLLYNAVLWLIPKHLPWYRISSFMSHPYLFMVIILLPCYFLVTFSLYNQCLILENKSVIGVFRRSYELVKSSWWQFFGIYLATAWVASVITSVLFGFAFLALSVVLPELALVRDALLPVGFFTLFLGGNIEIVLGGSLSVLTTTAILVVRGLISAFLVPIWAILTTYLYLEASN